MRRLIASLAALALTAPAAQAEGPLEGPSTPILDQARSAIVRVLSSGCPDGERAASGFVWADHGVVTDLHVIAGCKTVQVMFQDVGFFPARLLRVKVDADLVLLEVPGAPKVQGLSAADRPPEVGERVNVFGYPLGVPRRDTMPLSISYATKESPLLQDGLSPEAAEQLRAQRFPSMRTEVLHVNGGNLVPGHSGAALIDWQGKVLGIGSGGLASGSAGIGWAVRATYLNALPDAATTIPPLGTKAAAAFAVAMPNRGAGDSVTCGALPLFRTRQSTLGEIARTNDDPDRIEGLASEIGGVPFEALKAVRATIWVERQSGAAIVVPEGATLSAGDPFCAVTTADPDVSMLVRLDPLPMQEGTVEWDVEKFKLQNRSHRLVRSVSDSRIVYRGHGLVSGVHLVNGAEVLRRLGEATPPDGRRVRIYRADMAGRGAAVVVAAIAHDLKPASAGARGMPWAASVLAVHLSSFPPRLRETQGQGTEPAARAYKRIRCGEGELSPLGQAGPPPEPDPQIAALQRTAFGGELPRTRAAVAWTSPRWGFQIYLPEGVEPKPDDDACVFASRDPALRYAIRLAQQPGGDQIRKARDAETEEFRARLARLSGAPLREIASSTGDTSAPRGATYAVLQGELPGAGRVLALLADLRPNFGMPRYLQALVGAVYIEPNPAGERPAAFANAVRDLMASSAPPR